MQGFNLSTLLAGPDEGWRPHLECAEWWMKLREEELEAKQRPATSRYATPKRKTIDTRRTWWPPRVRDYREVSAHGMTGTPEYRCWSAMKARCGRPNNPAFRDYGARGIRVCARWSKFANFYADMGPRPSAAHSLDRIDVNGGYEPDNCRWATRSEQGLNKRNTALTFQGETRPAAHWAADLGLKPASLRGRLRSGVPPDVAFTTPVGVPMTKREDTGALRRARLEELRREARCA
jgi:hypothetical protein